MSDYSNWRKIDAMPAFTHKFANKVRKAMYRAHSKVDVVVKSKMDSKVAQLATCPMPTLLCDESSGEIDPKWGLLALSDEEFERVVSANSTTPYMDRFYDTMRTARTLDARTMEERQARAELEATKTTTWLMPDGTQVAEAFATEYIERLLTKIEVALGWSRNADGFSDPTREPPASLLEGLSGTGPGSLFDLSDGKCCTIDQDTPPRADLWKREEWRDEENGRVTAVYVPRKSHPKEIDLQLVAPDMMPLTAKECAEANVHLATGLEEGSAHWLSLGEEGTYEWAAATLYYACCGHRPAFDHLSKDREFLAAARFSANAREWQVRQGMHGMRVTRLRDDKIKAEKNRKKRERKKRRDATAKAAEAAASPGLTRLRAAIRRVVLQNREHKRLTKANEEESERRRRMRAAINAEKARRAAQWDAKPLPGIAPAVGRRAEEVPSASDLAAAAGKKAVALNARKENIRQQRAAKAAAEAKHRKAEEERERALKIGDDMMRYQSDAMAKLRLR